MTRSASRSKPQVLLLMVLKQFHSVRSYPHSAANKVDQSKHPELEKTRELLQEGGGITHDDVQN